MQWQALLATVIVAALAACSGPVYEHRYRLTVEIETPDGVKSGSSVIEVALWSERVVGHGLTGQHKVTGDAVFVDLGHGRNVIATFGFGPDAKQDRFHELAFKVLGLKGVPTDWPKPQQMRGKFDVPAVELPTLVTFSDINDPLSAKVVFASDFAARRDGPRVVAVDALAATFGPGHRLHRAWIEPTRDPVTRGIQTKLPWWDQPLPWLRPAGGGGWVDTRPQTGFIVNKGLFKM